MIKVKGFLLQTIVRLSRKLNTYSLHYH